MKKPRKKPRVEGRTGRPAEHTLPELLEHTGKYLELCSEDIEHTRVKSLGKTGVSYELSLKVKLPSIEGLAQYLDVHKDTVYDWGRKYPAFSAALKQLADLQHNKLVENGLAGTYNPVIAKLILTSKHGYFDKAEVEPTLPPELITALAKISSILK